MARVTPFISNFTAGEVSPRMAGRLDVDRYYNSARRLQDFLVDTRGGAFRRPGSRFVTEIQNSANAADIIGFQFNDEQAYAIEHGAGYFRFYTNGGRIEVDATDAAIANGDYTSNINDWDDRSTGAAAISHDATNGRLNLDGSGSDVAHAEQDVATTNTGQLHVIRFRVIGLSDDVVRLRIGTSSTGAELLGDIGFGAGDHCMEFTPTASPFYVQFLHAFGRTIQIDDVSLIDGAPVEIGTGYSAGQLASVRFTQSADVMTLAHKDVHTIELSRNGNHSWSATEVDFIDGPYLEENTTDTTLSPSAASGDVTITASDTDGINGGDGFVATDVGRLVRMKHGSDWGNAKIYQVNSTTEVLARTKVDFGGTTAVTAWRLGLYSDTDGWPRTVQHHEERRWFAGAGRRPQRVDGSKTNDFANFTPETEDNDAVAFNVASDQVNIPRWLLSARQLFMGTLGAELKIGADSLNSAITPTNIVVRPETREGCADVAPVPINGGALFLQRHRRKVIEFTFSLDQDAHDSNDLTILADHIAREGIAALAFAAEPVPILFAARDDGRLLAMTYARKESVVGWTQSELGGAGIVESLAVIAGDQRDELWMIVKRTIDGSTKRYVEYLAPALRDEDDQEAAVYVDSSLELDNTVDATLTPGAATGDGVTFTAGSSVFVAGDVGREIHLRYRDGEDPETLEPVFKTAIAEITTFNSGTSVDADIKAAFPSTDTIAAGGWRLSVTEISGLDHLEGEAVDIWGDGSPLPSATVSSGTITLARPTGRAQVGLGYVSELRPQRFEAGAREGAAQGKRQRIGRIMIRFHRTLGAEYGRDLDTLRRVPFARGKMDEAPRLFTGDRRVDFPGDYSLDPSIVVRQTQPGPCNVIAIAPQLEVNEG